MIETNITAIDIETAEKIFLKEVEYRIEIFKDHLDKAIAPKNNKIKKIKI